MSNNDLPSKNPFSISTRSYNEILSKLNELYPNKPAFIKVIFAGMFSVLYWLVDARANESLITTAQSYEGILAHAASKDYQPTPRSTAFYDVTVTLEDSVELPVIVGRDDLSFTVTSRFGTGVSAILQEDATFTTKEKVLYLREGSRISKTIVGHSDGETKFFELPVRESSVLPDTIRVWIGENEYDVRDSLVNSFDSDRHCRIVWRGRENPYPVITFGDGVMGAIAEEGTVYASFMRGGGRRGNIQKDGSSVSATGALATIVNEAELISNGTGGGDMEDPETVRMMAVWMQRLQYLAVNEIGYRVLARRFSTGVLLAQCFPQFYGAQSVGIHIIPVAGTEASTSLKMAMQNWLRNRSVLSNVDVRVRDALYHAINITVQVRMANGYIFDNFKDLIKLSVKLIVNPNSVAVLRDYQSMVLGSPNISMESIVEYINIEWGFEFDIEDHGYIRAMIERRTELRWPFWGLSFRPNDVISVIDVLPFIDYVHSVSPDQIVEVFNSYILTDESINIQENTHGVG